MKIIEDRDERILDAALKLAEEDHFQFITREKVAAKAGVSPATINNAFGTMPDLKRAVLSAAVERRVLAVIRQGIGESHPIVMKADKDLLSAAVLQSIA